MVAPQTSLTHLTVRAVVVAGVALVWASLFTFEPLRVVVDAVVDVVRPRLPGLVRWPGWEHVLAPSALVVVFSLVLAVLAVAVHGPVAAGVSPPTPTGVRLTWVALLLAAAGQVALGWGLVAGRVELAIARPMPWQWLSADVALIVSEHIVAQCAVFALALPFGIPPVDERRRTGLPGLRFLAGLGIGALQDARLAGPRTFLAVPVEVWPAIGAQAVVFSLLAYVPLTAPVWLALVGGLAAGWLTARTGSLWPALFVRLATSHIFFAAAALLWQL